MLSGNWAAPSSLTAVQNSWQHKVVVDGAGRSWVIWIDNGIWVSRFNGVWSQPLLLADGQGRMFGSLTVASNGRGDLLIAWKAGEVVDGRVQGYSHLTARYTDASGWSAPEKLTTVPSAGASLQEPVVAMSDGGAAVVAWQVRRSREPSEMWVAGYDPAYGWSAAEQVARGSLIYGAPALGLSSRGTAVLAWSETAEGTTRVWARRGRPGAWQEPSLLTERQGFVEKLWAGMSQEGAACVLWLHATEDGQARAISGRESTTSGNWLQATSVVTGLHSWWSGGSPHVAFGRSGHAIVAWRQVNEDETESALMTRQFAPTVGWGAPMLAAPALPPPYMGCAEVDGVGLQASIDGTGNAVVVWEHKMAAWELASHATYRPAGGSWSDAVQLNPKGASTWTPTVATGGGVAVAAWFQDNEDHSRGLWTSRLAP